MANHAYSLLKENFLFQGLPDECLVALSKGTRVQNFPTETILFNQGEVPDFLYIAVEGSFELFVTDADGDETVVEISSAPNAYTIGAVLTGATYIVSGRVLQKARLLMLDARELTECVAKYPVFSQNLLGHLTWQFRTMVRQVVSLKTKSTAERLGCHLLTLWKDRESQASIELPYDNRRLATRLGMTTVSLSRAFKILNQHGISHAGKKVRITDEESLRTFCQPDEFLNELERPLPLRKLHMSD